MKDVHPLGMKGNSLKLWRRKIKQAEELIY